MIGYLAHGSNQKKLWRLVNSMLAALVNERYVSHLAGSMIETLQPNDTLPVSCDTGLPDHRRIPLLPRSTIMAHVLSKPLIPGEWMLSCVFYPDLLGHLLSVTEVDQRDLRRMIARCLEHTDTEYFGEESLRILLRRTAPTACLYLQPWHYAVDAVLYQKAAECGVTDVYYQSWLTLT
jgi:hypothetical protein